MSVTDLPVTSASRRRQRWDWGRRGEGREGRDTVYMQDEDISFQKPSSDEEVLSSPGLIQVGQIGIASLYKAMNSL